MNSFSLKACYLFLVITTLIFISCSDEITYPEGGYSYLEKVDPNDSNFYFLPIRKSIDRRDSINVLLEKTVYTSFHEPNLSIMAPPEDIFRFYYSGWPGETAMISLTKDKIVIKEARTGSPYPAPNENVLDSIEKLHYDLFDDQYLLSDPKFPAWKKRYLDSLLNTNPKLFDPAYFLQLHSKLFSINQPFEYTKKEFKIPAGEFKSIINLFNNSGFWKKHYYNFDCSIMDGEEIMIEAITKKKYKSIFFKLCPEDSSNLRKAYNEILKYAGIKDGSLGRQDSIIKWSPEKVEVRELKLIESKPEAKKKAK